jgi:hypothetical protein
MIVEVQGDLGGNFNLLTIVSLSMQNVGIQQILTGLNMECRDLGLASQCSLVECI